MGKLKHWLFKKLYSTLITQNYHTSSANVSLGSKAQCTGNFFDGTIKIGSHAMIRRSELLGCIDIGNFTALNGPNIDIYAGNGKVTIGNFCSIARNVSFQVDAHNHQKLTTYLIYKNVFREENSSEVITPGNISIGHDVWIGSHSIILGNVKIGNGAVVAANSVINSDIPSFAIVAGSPARIIKYRFDKDTIKQITDLAWWNWDIEKLKENKELFTHEIIENSIINDLK